MKLFNKPCYQKLDLDVQELITKLPKGVKVPKTRIAKTEFADCVKYYAEVKQDKGWEAISRVGNRARYTYRNGTLFGSDIRLKVYLSNDEVGDYSDPNRAKLIINEFVRQFCLAVLQEYKDKVVKTTYEDWP